MQFVKFDLEAHRDHFSGHHCVVGVATELVTQPMSEPRFEDVSAGFTPFGSEAKTGFAIEATFTAPHDYTDAESVFSTVAARLGLKATDVLKACRKATAPEAVTF